CTVPTNMGDQANFFLSANGRVIQTSRDSTGAWSAPQEISALYGYSGSGYVNRVASAVDSSGVLGLLVSTVDGDLFYWDGASRGTSDIRALAGGSISPADVALTGSD